MGDGRLKIYPCGRREISVFIKLFIRNRPVGGEGLVDKISELGLWPFFTSYVCKV